MNSEHAKNIGRLYPDLLAAGGLALGLEQALVEAGSTLHVSTLDEGLDAEQKKVVKGLSHETSELESSALKSATFFHQRKSETRQSLKTRHIHRSRCRS